MLYLTSKERRGGGIPTHQALGQLLPGSASKQQKGAYPRQAVHAEPLDATRNYYPVEGKCPRQAVHTAPLDVTRKHCPIEQDVDLCQAVLRTARTVLAQLRADKGLSGRGQSLATDRARDPGVAAQPGADWTCFFFYSPTPGYQGAIRAFCFTEAARARRGKDRE